MLMKGWAKILPAINACMIGGLILYFFNGEIPGWIIMLIAIFFIFAQDLKKQLVQWYTIDVSTKVHKVVFCLLALVWIWILIIHVKPNSYENEQ